MEEVPDPGGGGGPPVTRKEHKGTVKEDEVFKPSKKTSRSPIQTGESEQANIIKSGPAGNRINAFAKLMFPAMTRSASEQNLSSMEYAFPNDTMNGLNNESESMGSPSKNPSKRILSPNADELVTKKPKAAASALHKAQIKIDELMLYSNNHPTTARALKLGLKQLKGIIDDLSHDWRGLRNQLENQTEENVCAPDIRAKIKLNMEEREIEELVSEPWPANSFQNTTFNPRELGGKAALKSTLLNIENFAADQNFLKLNQLVPETKTITADHLRTNGNVEISTNHSTTIPGLMASSNTERWYAIHPAIDYVDGEVSTSDVINWMECTRRTLKKTNTKLAEIFFPRETKSLDKLRKIIECCLTDSDIKILLRPSKEQRVLFRNTHQRHPNHQSLIIRRKEEASFADVVKELKRNISPEELGIEVRSVRSTQKGDVRIYLKENTPGARLEMIRRIKSKVTSAQSAEIAEKTKGIVILDIEEDITADEVLDTIQRILGVEKDKIKANEIRKMKRGTQMLTVFLPEPAAVAAIQMKRIKIGWTSCQIKEKCDPPFCSHCKVYISEGHKCIGDAVTVRCFRCSGNHQTRECKSEKEFCFSCQSEGHRANQMRCPMYRSLIKNVNKQ